MPTSDSAHRFPAVSVRNRTLVAACRVFPLPRVKAAAARMRAYGSKVSAVRRKRYRMVPASSTTSNRHSGLSFRRAMVSQIMSEHAVADHARPRRHSAHRPARRLYGCCAGFGMCHGPCRSMDSNSQISTRWLTFGTTPDELADYFPSLRKRSMSCSASLIAAARLARVTPVLLFPSPKLISHRHPVLSSN